MKKYVKLLIILSLSAIFLKCESKIEEEPSLPGINLKNESVLYENNQFNNSNPKAIYSEENKEIYIVFTRVPPTLDSTAIMFAVISEESGEVIQPAMQIGSTISISSFPNIALSANRIFITWHGQENSIEGLVIVELSSNGIIERSFISNTAPPGTSKGDVLLASQTTLSHFFNAELIEDKSSMIAIQASTISDIDIESEINFGTGLIHNAYWDNGLIKVVYTQNGKLKKAVFDQQSGSLENIIDLESIEHFDPVISFSPLNDGETVAAIAQISKELSLQFYSSDDNQTKTVGLSSEAYNFSNIIVNDSMISIAWVTSENNLNFTLYNYLSSQLYKAKQMNNSTAGIAIEPLLLYTPSGIYTFWRDTRNNSGGDIYYRYTDQL